MKKREAILRSRLLHDTHLPSICARQYSCMHMNLSLSSAKLALNAFLSSNMQSCQSAITPTSYDKHATSQQASAARLPKRLSKEERSGKVLSDGACSQQWA